MHFNLKNTPWPIELIIWYDSWSNLIYRKVPILLVCLALDMFARTTISSFFLLLNFHIYSELIALQFSLPHFSQINKCGNQAKHH